VTWINNGAAFRLRYDEAIGYYDKGLASFVSLSDEGGWISLIPGICCPCLFYTVITDVRFENRFLIC
jgi:hypothetical protein